jgi:[acyl-carrier-protein] S-malonyltransferase
MQSFAFVFPGQGSQSVGMLDAWGDHPVVLEVLNEASDALDEDIGKLIHDGPKEALALTTHTQPAMLVAAVAAFRVWMAETGAMPAALAGHSLGEYSAMVAAGVVSLRQAAPLVRFRAQAMQDAVPVGVGAMAAVMGMPATEVVAICRDVTQSFGVNSLEIVEAVNFNDPAQTVIAGSKAAVDSACQAAKAQGAKRALPLQVSAPFHSSLMRPAAERLRERLDLIEFSSPSITLINNVDVAVEVDADRIRDALYRQAFSPVRWVECVQAIKAHGIASVVECGPGKVLAGMVKRIDPDMNGMAMMDPSSLTDVKRVLLGGEHA